MKTRSRQEPKATVHYWLLIIVALGLLSLAVGHFGGNNALDEAPAAIGSGEQRPESRIYTVTYRFGVFSPTNLRIRAGDTVTFKNDDTAGIRITTQLNPRTQRAEFDSVGPVPPNSSFSYTFTNEGVFAYHNAEDTRQAGVIIVRAP